MSTRSYEDMVIRHERSDSALPFTRAARGDGLLRAGSAVGMDSRWAEQMHTHTTEEMLSTTPNKPAIDRGALAQCIDACGACEIACVSCADACLGEMNVMMLRACIGANLGCADLCAATMRAACRLYHTDVDVLRAQLELCATWCEACERECRRHEHMEHCRVCADACRDCAQACRTAAQAAD
jgi:hypothetical protein